MFERCLKFGPKIIVGVVFFLVFDVVDDFGDVPATDAERTVESLPFEMIFERHLIIDEMGGCALHLLHQFGDADCGRQRQKDVNMIFGAVDGQHATA